VGCSERLTVSRFALRTPHGVEVRRELEQRVLLDVDRVRRCVDDRVDQRVRAILDQPIAVEPQWRGSVDLVQPGRVLALLVGGLERLRAQLLVELGPELRDVDAFDIADRGGIPGARYLASEHRGTVAVLAAGDRDSEGGHGRHCPMGYSHGSHKGEKCSSSSIRTSSVARCLHLDGVDRRT